MSPGAGEVIRRARVAADLPAHIPPAPRAGPTRIVMTTTSIVMVMRPMMVRPSLCARSNQTKHCHCSHGSTDHGSSLLRGRSRLAIKKPLMGGHTKCQAALFEGADYTPLLARLRNRPWLKWGISQGGTRDKREALAQLCMAAPDQCSRKKFKLDHSIFPFDEKPTAFGCTLEMMKR
jgi:hypothetical protein